MLITKKVEIKVSARTSKHFESKGYCLPRKCSKNGNKDVIDFDSKIEVFVEDLLPSSHVNIKYQCDNCGKIVQTKYCDWNSISYKQLGDLCKDCAIKIKLPQIMLERYGQSNCAHIGSFVEKKKQTNLEKYGNVWAIASDSVRTYIKESLIKKYGVNNPMLNENIKNKALLTNNQRYGGNGPMCDLKVRQKAVKTCLDKYGVPNAFQNKGVQNKAHLTLYKNKKVPSSKAEKKLYDIIVSIFGDNNCYFSYPEGEFFLDCLLVVNGIKIDIEYDGLYWHKNRKQKDAARNAILMKKGYKILRIKGNNQDILPSQEKIKEVIKDLILNDRHLLFIDMNI